MSGFKLTPIGVLNKFEQSNNTKFFNRSDSSIGHLRNIVKEVSAPSVVPDTQYFIGEVLYVFPDNAAEKAADTMPAVFEKYFEDKQFKMRTVQIIARIPELHAFLREPVDFNDFTTISLYPVFSALKEGTPIPIPGQLVYLDFKNRTNMEGGIYMGTFEESQGNVNGATGAGVLGSRAAFNGAMPSPQGLIQLPRRGLGYDRLTKREFMTWGIPRLISTIETVCAEAVQRIAKITGQSAGDPRLAVIVKDLNTADGLPTTNPQTHKTHWQGKSVDFGYYYRTPSGAIENRFINRQSLRDMGYGGWDKKNKFRTLKMKHAEWDIEANWQFTLAMLNAPSIIQILVDNLYCVELERKASEHFGANSKEYKRARDRIIQETGNHDNHFHVNI